MATKKIQRNMSTINNTKKEEKNMNTKSTKSAKITKTATTKTTKNTKINKEENTMKKNVEIGTVGASVTLTKVGTGTITFTQPKEHDKVIYTVFGVPTEITADEAPQKIAQFVANGWKIGEIVEHKASAPTPNYSEIYRQNLEEIQNRAKITKSTKKEQKTYAPKLTKGSPKQNNKKSNTEKKPTTYGEAITQKYGTEEHRKAVGAMTRIVATEWRDQYLKTGKVVCKRSEYRQKLWAEAEKRVNEAEKKA